MPVSVPDYFCFYSSVCLSACLYTCLSFCLSICLSLPSCIMYSLGEGFFLGHFLIIIQWTWRFFSESLQFDLSAIRHKRVIMLILVDEKFCFSQFFRHLLILGKRRLLQIAKYGIFIFIFIIFITFGWVKNSLKAFRAK